MRCIFPIIISCLVLVGCFKEENTLEPMDISEPLTGVELAIFNGETMVSILANFSVSDLYGVNYQGGLIFYVDSVNATGLVAIQDVNKADPLMNWWHIHGYSLHGLDVSVWSGQNNTDIIVNTQADGDYAAYYCDTLNFSGYSDWFMPSQDELSWMYIHIGDKAKANFESLGYMSSSKDSVLVNTNPVFFAHREIGIRFDLGAKVTFTNHDISGNFFQTPGYIRPVRQFN
tara:strand:+ start:362 stop:1051 length:690 start_codon:yes stop_codon:yes gene_type:complete